MNDDEIRSLLHEMRQDPVPADSLARVRRAVEQRTQRSRAWRWIVPMVLAGCCVCAMLVAVLRWPVIPVPPAPPPITARQVPPDLPAPPVPMPAIRRVLHPVRPAPSPRLPGTVVRIQTNDPDVVILLVG